MKRRQFIGISAAGIAGLALNGADIFARNRKSAKAEGSSYSVVMLGDTHFDMGSMETYHDGYSDPNPTRDAAHKKEIARNLDMWKARCPRIVERASRLIDADTKFIYQTGDIIQGDTPDFQVHRNMLDDSVNFLKARLGAIPFVTVVGNHDVRGNDDKVAAAAYKYEMNARMGAELGRVIESNNFSFRVGPDVYIAVDFNEPDDDAVISLLEQSADARYTFILIHAPVFPYESKRYGDWYYHGRKQHKPENRARMRAIFAQRQVIVLCGHTHLTEFYDWYGEGGRITQMTMSSVWAKDAQGEYKPASDLATYTIAGKEQHFDEVRDGLRQYIHANCCGCYKLNVSDDGVTVDFYAGDSEDVTAQFKLR